MLCSEYYLEQQGIGLLLKIGADPNIQDDKGVYPLYAVLYSSKRETYDLETRIKIISMLLRRGADPNLRTKDGFTVLSKHHRIEQLRKQNKKINNLFPKVQYLFKNIRKELIG